MPKHVGECYCASVKFYCDSDPLFTQYCHCNKCREVASQSQRDVDKQGYSWTAGYLRSNFNIVAGNDNLDELIRNNAKLLLCKSCHSLIYGMSLDPEKQDGIGINANNFHFTASIPESFKPVRHIWYVNRVVDFNDKLPKFKDAPKEQYGSGELWDGNDVTIRAATVADSVWLDELMIRDWGGLPLVIRGEKYYPSQLNGLIAERANTIAGFLFYETRGRDCEIIVLEVFDKFKGTGTLLLEKLKTIANDQTCSRLYLMTTNDNLDALRFYQKRGFHICGVHVDSVKRSRKIKPTIGMIGDYDIPIRDEIDLEFIL